MRELIVNFLAVIANTHPELLQEALKESVSAVGYREDGWSDVTDHGCRSHRLIDEALEQLSQGDKYDRQVAQEAAKWFCFHPDRFPEMRAEVDEEVGVARGAYNRTWGASLIFQGRSGLYPLDFRVPLADPDPRNNRYFDTLDSHAVVYDPSGDQDAPALFPEQYVESLDNKADRLREAGESDDTQPRPSPGG